MTRYENWLKRLQSKGYRLTNARKVVIETISSSRFAYTPQQVFESAKKKNPAIGLVTVYRTMEKLEQLGLVQRVHQESGCNAYLPNRSRHHHLIIYEACGRADYFDGDDLGLLFRRVSKDYGYNIRKHWLQLTGICRDCQNGQ
jgi:Fur family ferric uptake transcriptional regulator